MGTEVCCRSFAGESPLLCPASTSGELCGVTGYLLRCFSSIYIVLLAGGGGRFDGVCRGPGSCPARVNTVTDPPPPTADRATENGKRESCSTVLGTSLPPGLGDQHSPLKTKQTLALCFSWCSLLLPSSSLGLLLLSSRKWKTEAKGKHRYGLRQDSEQAVSAKRRAPPEGSWSGGQRARRSEIRRARQESGGQTALPDSGTLVMVGSPVCRCAD